MFIRFVSGEIDERSHVAAGLFCAALALRKADELPRYEFEALSSVRDWFDDYLESPFDHLPQANRYERAVSWFKPTAGEYLARAWELISILERNDVPIWTIRSRKTGYVHYEDDVQIFAEPFYDIRFRLLGR